MNLEPGSPLKALAAVAAIIALAMQFGLADPPDRQGPAARPVLPTAAATAAARDR